MWMALLYWKREVKQIGPGLPHAAHKVHAVRRRRARLLIIYCSGQRVCAHVSWLCQCPIVDDSHLYFLRPHIQKWSLFVSSASCHWVSHLVTQCVQSYVWCEKKKSIMSHVCSDTDRSGLCRHVVFFLISFKVTWLHYQNATVGQKAKTFISRHLSTLRYFKFPCHYNQNTFCFV